MKPSAARVVEPELLDEIPPRDPRSLRSRRDLRLLNFLMGHPHRMAAALSEHWPAGNPARIVELGAGDGHFLLNVARRLQSKWPTAEATLVDRLEAFDPDISERFDSLGWTVRTEKMTAMEWLRQSPPGAVNAIISNLFFHQFRMDELAEMFRLAAGLANVIVALEPSRSWRARFGGRLLWIIGCSSVTRHDADISIRAGFFGSELLALWPEPENWALTERSAGLFSHLFIARRKEF
ncbi:MAG TPA: class I SAM-dependent methyltransferase [Verrucomicrobiae bacterium]|nr:class I SAM-dependent methyltransferase [Verrucomicrobiae bacterium]